MKKIIALFMFFVLLLSFAACSSHKETMQDTEGTAVLSGEEESQESTNDNTEERTDTAATENEMTSTDSTEKPADKTYPPEESVNPLPQQTQSAKQPEPTLEPISKQPETTSNPTLAETVPDTPPREPEPSSEPVTEQPEEPKEEEPVKQAQFYMIVGETTFTADFADNSSADAFRELLAQGDLTINMSDYGSFEKVGSIGQSLPREDTQISTTTGDVILYQGNQIVVFYGTNSWSYTRLGKIQNATKDDLLTAFGSGNVTITFSLTK